jgi:hypothetical protein
MRLEDITVAVRPRSGWDAIDLGLRMYQQWWRPVTLAWLCFALPLMLGVYLFLHDHLFWCMLTIWWLKPIYGRFPLYVYSHALFGTLPRPRDSYKAMLKLYFPHLIKALTVYRFDPARSFNLPVWQLEKLKGRARRERTRILQRQTYNPAVNLALLGLLFEAAVFMSLVGLVYMAIPLSQQMVDVGPFDGSLPQGGVNALFVSFQILTYSVMEPIYIAAGFSLYINRRTLLEGWDIEIAFRRMARRIKEQFNRTNVAALIGALAMVLTLVSATPGHALAANADETGPAVDKAGAKTLIEEILKAPEFGHTKEVKGWYPKKPKDKPAEPKESGLWDWLAPVFEFIARVFGVLGQALLWLAVALAIAFLVLLLVRYGPHLGSPKAAGSSQRRGKPKTLFGMAITPASLPDDIPASARGLLQQGRLREALSLLYRGALSKLTHEHGIPLKDSATEGDCVRMLKSRPGTLAPDAVGYFQDLTRVWQGTAYGKRTPPQGELLSLCDSWAVHFHGGVR